MCFVGVYDFKNRNASGGIPGFIILFFFVISVPGIVTNAMSASGMTKSTIGLFGDGVETLWALDRSEPANSQHLFRNATSCFLYPIK